MSKTLKQKLVAYALVLPAFLVVMLTVAYPIVSAVIQSFQDEKTGAFTLDNYAYFFTEPSLSRWSSPTCSRSICASSIRASQRASARCTSCRVSYRRCARFTP